MESNAPKVAVLVDLELRSGLATQEIVARLRLARRGGDAGAHALSFYLADMEARGLHQELGFPSAERFAEVQLGLAASTAREYLAVGRALEDLPRIEGALRNDRLTWSQARLLARIATAETETAWVEWAEAKTVREIARHAGLREKGQLPTDPARRRIHETKFKVIAKLDLLQHEVWNNALAKLQAETGEAASDSDVLLRLAHLYLSLRPDGSLPGFTRVNESHYRVVIGFDAATGATTLRTAEGPVPLEAEAARHVLREAGRADLVEGVGESAGDENSGLPVPESQRDVPTPPALRDRVLARDGFRCLACTSKRNLTVHHKKWRRFGGRTVPENLCSLCIDCHSLVHDRLLRIEGALPGGLRFVDREGRELRRCVAGAGSAAPDAHASANAAVEIVPLADARASSVAVDAEARARAALPVPNLVAAVTSIAPAVLPAIEPAGVAASEAASADEAGSRQLSAMADSPTPAAARERPTQRLRFHDIPQDVDVDWWQRHAHLFRWRDGELLFEPGQPRELVQRSGLGTGLFAQPPADARAPRPERLADVIGQGRVVANLSRAVAAAKARGVPLAHVLLAGPPGLGKTSLAQAVAAEMGSDPAGGATRVSAPAFHGVHAPAIQGEGGLLRLLASLGERDVVFVDEIHALPARVAECLYGAMEDGRLALLVHCEGRERVLRVRLAPFTLIGATTDEDRVPPPMRQRFAIREQLEFYGEAEITELLARQSSRHGLMLDALALRLVAGASRDTPREALSLLQAVRDEAIVVGVSAVNAALVARTFERLGLDERGLRPFERDYLQVLREARRPLGLATLAARLGTSRQTLQSVHEPFLLRRGLVRLTPLGRMAA